MTPDALYMLITGSAPIVSYAIAQNDLDSFFNPIGTVLAAVAGAVIGGITAGDAWRGAAVASGLSIGYQLYNKSKVQAALHPTLKKATS